MAKYYDKNGKEIVKGMVLQHDDGDKELVYECINEYGELNLGFNASNENYVGFEGCNREIYPLHQFNLSEWKIVSEGDKVEGER